MNITDISIKMQRVSRLSDGGKDGVLVMSRELDDILQIDEIGDQRKKNLGAFLSEYLEHIFSESSPLTDLRRQRVFVEIPMQCWQVISGSTMDLLKRVRRSDIYVVVLYPEQIVNEMHCDPGALAYMEELRAMGIDTGVSRLGTGYSSPSRLKKCAFDYFFADPSFLTDETDPEQRKWMIKAISDLVTALSKIAAMEGVDSQLHKDLLKQYDYSLVAEK